MCDFSNVSDDATRAALQCIYSKGINQTQLKASYDLLHNEINDLKQSVGTKGKYQSTYTTDAEKAGFGGIDYDVMAGDVYANAKKLQQQEEQTCCDPSKADCKGKQICLKKEQVAEGTGTFDFGQKNLKFYGGSNSGKETYTRKFREKYCYPNGQFITF
jgi:hypothetical protein